MRVFEIAPQRPERPLSVPADVSISDL